MQRRHFIVGGAAFCASSPFGGTAALEIEAELRVPPEESQHERTFMQWPVDRNVYPDRAFLDMLQQTIADIANTIAEFEPVTLLAAKDDHRIARKVVSDAVELWDIPTEDLWCRDSGPLFAKKPDGTLAVSHLRFNGWGEKQVHQRDGRIAAQIADRLTLPLIDSSLKGEAGGVEHDGHGLLIAHESSWVNENRNPGLSRDMIEERLLAAYGAQRMIWSPGVLGQDITDYHIDSLARFTGQGRVLVNLPDYPDTSDAFHRAALETYEELLSANLEIEVIPEPEQRRVRDVDFVASYANFYACNGAIIAAQFGDNETDRIAQASLAKHYPDREVVALNVDALGEIGGGIHCATQQMPA